MTETYQAPRNSEPLSRQMSTPAGYPALVLIPALLLAVALGITLAAGVTTIRQPEFGDGQAYMIPNALHMMGTFSPFIENEVHPPFYFMLQGLAFRTCGARVDVAHAMGLACALLCLVAVYMLGVSLSDRMVGAMAALLLAAWPPFLVQSTLVRLDIPVAAFSLATLVAAQRGWPWTYALFGSMAVLTKAPGVLAPGVLVGLATLRLWRPRFSRVALWIPVVVYLGWLGACKLHYGWFFLPENVDDFARSHGALAFWQGFQFWTRRLMCDQWSWVPFGLGAVAGSWRRPLWLLPLPLLGIVGLVLPTVTLVSGLSMGLFVSLCLMGWRSGGFYRVLPVLALMFVFLFAPYHYEFPRYMLPAWPGLALCCAWGLRRWSVGWVAAVGAAALMGAASFDGHASWERRWSIHESTFDVVDFVRCRAVAAEFLESGWDGRPVLTTPKAREDLSIPALGYVRNPLTLARADASCGRLRECSYYYELSTQAGRPEAELRRRLKRCGIELALEKVCKWENALSTGHAALYRLVPATQSPAEAHRGDTTEGPENTRGAGQRSNSVNPPAHGGEPAWTTP